MNANFKATGAANAATPVAPGEVTDALKQWAWYWFGPDADEAWIAQALANLPAGALCNPAPVAAPAPAVQFTEQEMDAEPRIYVHPGDYERRADGKVVRKDRWEWGIRNIVTTLWGVRHEFEIEDVVNRVRELAAPAPASEAVAEIVTFGGLDGQKEVSWRKGKMPPIGTKLYATPIPGDSADAPVQQAGPDDSDMVNAAYCLHKYRQGTDNGIAFNRGARWMRAALKGEQPVEPSGSERGNAA